MEQYNINELINSISTDWKYILDKNEYIEDVNTNMSIECNKYTILPQKKEIFNCFTFFNFSECKVVILGQDPYINTGEAHGLSFSVPSGIRIPPSLRNIIKEINRTYDLNIGKEKSDLTNWAKQGVLLLNKTLSVRLHNSNSHAYIWNNFTNNIIKYISDNSKNIVFMLWGANAHTVIPLIDTTKHLILKSGHPSPLNRKKDFIGNNHFILANEYLHKHNIKEIDWNI